MSCTAILWTTAIGSLLLGGLLSWAYFNDVIKKLKSQISSYADNLINVENEYAALRASTKEQILTLKDEKLEPVVDAELTKKYDKLKVDYDGLKSKLHAAERTIESKAPSIDTEKVTKLESEIVVLKEKLESSKKESVSDKGIKEIKKKSKKKNKTIKELKAEIDKLESELKEKSKKHGIEKRVKIVKSLKVNKLKDWLKDDKAYRVKKKVSTSKIKPKK